MPLSGLRQKHPLCKICLSFEEDVLNEFTADILLKRRTYKEMREHYTPMLKEGVKPLSDFNINNHRKHSDPGLLIEQVLTHQGLPTNEGDIVAQLYQLRYKQKLDKRMILQEIYRERLKNLETVQKLLDEQVTKWKKEGSAMSPFEMDDVRGKMVGLTLRIDGIHDSLQQVLIKEVNSDKGLPEGGVHITQNFVTLVQGSLKGFLDELVPFLLHDVSADDPARGKSVIHRISSMMDHHLTPTLNDQKLLEEAQDPSVS